MNDQITLPYRILSVDPATTKSGWAIMVLEYLHPLRITIEAHGQIDGQKLLKQKSNMIPLFGKQFCVVDALYDEYCELISKYRVDQVVSEGAFGFSHMSALIALTLAINALRRASATVLNKDIAIIPPTITKLAFTGTGSADKDTMRLFYNKCTYLIKTDSEDITEHEIDAIAHTVGWIRRDLIGDVVQISAKDKRKSKLEKNKK